MRCPNAIWYTADSLSICTGAFDMCTMSTYVRMCVCTNAIPVSHKPSALM